VFRREVEQKKWEIPFYTKTNFYSFKSKNDRILKSVIKSVVRGELFQQAVRYRNEGTRHQTYPKSGMKARDDRLA